MILKLKAPIVGAQFRPPSILLLRVLPVGHPLYLEPEPTNEHDPNALRVMLLLSTLDLDNEKIANILKTADLTTPKAIDDYIDRNSFHIGYVANSQNPRSCQIDGKPSAGNREFLSAITNNLRYPASLTFSMSGQSLVEVVI